MPVDLTRPAPPQRCAELAFDTRSSSFASSLSDISAFDVASDSSFGEEPPPTCLSSRLSKRGSNTSAGKTVVIVGVGYVGAHLLERFSTAYTVIAYDASPSRRQSLRDEYQKNLDVLVVEDLEAEPFAHGFDLAMICVPTPLKDDRESIETAHLVASVQSVGRIAARGSTIVVESSVSVGMTRALLGDLASRGVNIGFSPERVDPGRVFPKYEDIPKIVSGIDARSLAVVQELYSEVFTTVVPVRSLEVAEFAKLYENCQRLVNIAFVNELADACSQHDVSVHDVLDACRTKPFGYSPFHPSLGAGGHCLPANAQYLLTNCEMPLLQHAANSNAVRPARKAHEVARLASQIRERDCLRRPPSVLLYGMGFKRGEASLAYAPTVTFADMLVDLGVCVSYIDPVVRATDAAWKRVSDLLDRPDEDAYDRLEYDFDVVVVAQPLDKRRRITLGCLQRPSVVFFSK